MREQAAINKTAWENRAYEAWNKRNGTPSEYATEIKSNPIGGRQIHQQIFKNISISGKKIANPCGSNGRQAVPLALLGADVTVFDISEENKQYALELAKETGVNIEYILGDFCETDLNKYGNIYDIIYAEGGILHYFSDIDMFTKMLYAITKSNGQLILSDFHPYRKINGLKQTENNYFDNQIHIGNVAYHGFFEQEEQEAFPKCSLRYYTLSEIINSVIASGFALKEFIEHPNFNDNKIPAEFTIIAYKN